MRIIKSIPSLCLTIKKIKAQNRSIGFVPTMVALHEGHLSLIRKSRRENAITIVSIFVNRKQFGPREDFSSYPRPDKSDILFAKKENVDIIFYPSEKEMYPTGFLTSIGVDRITGILCGSSPVLRSSVREFLCSEAMHHLGVPTTRALSLTLTGEQVIRDMLYDGHPAPEPGAVVCRVAPSFTRFGHFEILAARKETELLKRFTDFTIRTDFPELFDAGGDAKSMYLSWFEEVCRRTANMIVEWMRAMELEPRATASRPSALAVLPRATALVPTEEEPEPRATASRPLEVEPRP